MMRVAAVPSQWFHTERGRPLQMRPLHEIGWRDI